MLCLYTERVFLHKMLLFWYSYAAFGISNELIEDQAGTLFLSVLIDVWNSGCKLSSSSLSSTSFPSCGAL